MERLIHCCELVEMDTRPSSENQSLVVVDKVPHLPSQLQERQWYSKTAPSSEVAIYFLPVLASAPLFCLSPQNRELHNFSSREHLTVYPHKTTTIIHLYAPAHFKQAV